MSEHAPPPPARLPGLIGWLALLPGVLIGFCLGAWMLAIALEWLGEAFLWRNTCTSRSELILQATWQWWRNFAGAPVWSGDCQRYVAERERGADCFTQRAKRVVLDGSRRYGNPLRDTICG